MEKKVVLVKWFNWLFSIIPLSVVKKVLVTLVYEQVYLVMTYSFPSLITITEK